MTLHLYFARGYLRSFAAVLSVFFAIMTLFEAVELAQNHPSSGKGFGDFLSLALLHAPTSVYRMLPVISILAALALFLRMARSSELVVTRAAGRSGLGTLSAPIVTMFLISVLLIVLVNPIIAATAKKYDIETNRLDDNGGNVLSIGSDGLWLREGTAEGQTVVHAAQANADGTHLQQVTFFRYTENGLLRSRIDANFATLEDQEWHLMDGKLWRLEDTDNPEAQAFAFASLSVPSSLTRERIQQGFGEPNRIGFWDMPEFISRMEAAGFSARRHLVFFQMELAKPLLLIAMVMIGAGFTMRHSRFGRTGIMVLTAVICGFGVYLLRNFAQILGENGEIPVLVAAWAPPIAALLLAFSLLLHLEDG